MTSVMTSQSDANTRQASFGTELGERLWVILVAGIPTGVIVAGVGSRLAMFVLRLTSPDNVRGVTSDDGFEIGVFTFGGTYSLLILGAFVGVIGAVAYQAVAPWLLGPRPLRLFTVAAASGAVVGSMLVHEDGIDFHFLKPLWLAIGLFVVLPAAFGAAIAVAVEWIAERPVPLGHRRWVIPVLLVVAFPFVIPIVVVMAVIVALWVSIRRASPPSARVPTLVGLVIRLGWAGAALLGIVALVRDVQAQT